MYHLKVKILKNLWLKDVKITVKVQIGLNFLGSSRGSFLKRTYSALDIVAFPELSEFVIQISTAIFYWKSILKAFANPVFFKFKFLRNKNHEY